MSVDDNEFLIPIEESRRARPASVEQKALGNRLARLVGNRLADKPNIGQGRGRRGGMDIDAPTGGVRGSRKPTFSDFDPDNDGWVDEGSTNPRFIGVDSPTRGTETARRMSSGADEDYRGQHGAPGRGAGAPLHDMLADGGVYPEDVYSADAIRFYGVGDDQLDPIAASLIRRYKGKPNAEVTIYRAVPLSNAKQIEKLEKQIKRYYQYGKFPPDVPSSVKPRTTESNAWYVSVTEEIERLKKLPPGDIKITPGDWVTPIRAYAVMHGDGALNGDYQIIKKRVKAKDVYTAGDSWLEWGYDPEVTKKLSSGAEINNADISAAYTQEIFGKLKALKERLGYGTDFDEKVSKEILDTRIQETADYAKRIIDLDSGKDVVLPQRAIDYIKDVVARNAFFTSDRRKTGGASLMPIQAALGQSNVWPQGTPLPLNLSLEISRQIHIARGDTEMVAKIDEFKNYLKTATPEQLSEDIRAASLMYGESIEKRVLVRTRSVNPFVKGNRTILTQHDKEEREAAGIVSMNMMGDDITTSARRKTEANILGLPFEAGVEDSPEVRELRPTSGYITTSKTAAARRTRFKEIYGDDVELMYDGPAGAALEHSQNSTGKYGPSQFVLRPEVAERTRVVNDDSVAMSMKDNPPVQLSSLGEDGIFLGGTTNPIGMLYDYKTGDTFPTPSGAFEGSSDTHSSQGTAANYKEALVLGRFKPEEVEAIIAAPVDFRKEDGELSERLNPDNEANFSLLIDMARSRDELMQEHGIEVVPKIEDGVFRTDDVEMFNSSMTDVWFDKNFGDKGLSKEEIIPDKSTTPYEAYLRVLIASEELPEMFEYRGPRGKSEEEQNVWRREELKKELSRVLSVKTPQTPNTDDSRAFDQFEEQMGSRLSSGNKISPINIKLGSDYGDTSGKKDFTPEELKTIDEINERLSNSGIDFAWISLENEDGTKTSSPLINFSGRPIVIVRIDDETNVPFYRSTGLGGKDQDLYPAGKWYPFWGYSNSARFFVKNEGMQDYYGIPELQGMSQKLDEITVGLPAKLVGKEWRSVKSLEDGTMNDDFRNLINNTSFVNADRIMSDRDVRHHIDVSKKKLRESIRSKRNRNAENDRVGRLSSAAQTRVGARNVYDKSVDYNDKRNPSGLLETSRDGKEYSSIRFNGDGYDIKTSQSEDGFSVFVEDESGQIASLVFSEPPTGETTKLLSYKASKESQKAGVLEALLDHVLVKNPDTNITKIKILQSVDQGYLRCLTDIYTYKLTIKQTKDLDKKTMIQCRLDDKLYKLNEIKQQLFKLYC
jgi:hypothetical protein